MVQSCGCGRLCNAAQAQAWRVIARKGTYRAAARTFGQRRGSYLGQATLPHQSAHGRQKARCSPPCASVAGGETKAIAEAAAPDFELIRIPGNGSCMFQALAQGRHLLSFGCLLSNEALMREGFGLRRDICHMLERHRDDVEPFIGGDFAAYLSHMATEGVWGGEPELAMAWRVLRRPILVYALRRSSLFGSDVAKLSEYGADECSGVAPVCLLFGGSHYDLLSAKA